MGLFRFQVWCFLTFRPRGSAGGVQHSGFGGFLGCRVVYRFGGF